MGFIEERIKRRALAMFLVGILLMIGGCSMGLQQAKLKLFGATAVGKVSKPKVPTDASGRGSGKPYVEYSFESEDGTRYRSRARVSRSWNPPEDRQVEILYLRGDPETSRLREQSGLGAFLLMPLGVLLMLFGGYSYIRLNQS